MAKHRKGNVRCAICNHTWPACVEDEGFEPQLECPECGSVSGMFESSPEKEDERPRCYMCAALLKNGVCIKCNLTRGV
jgi:hypothetical protein